MLKATYSKGNSGAADQRKVDDDVRAVKDLLDNLAPPRRAHLRSTSISTVDQVFEFDICCSDVRTAGAVDPGCAPAQSPDLASKGHLTSICDGKTPASACAVDTDDHMSDCAPDVIAWQPYATL